MINKMSGRFSGMSFHGIAGWEACSTHQARCQSYAWDRARSREYGPGFFVRSSLAVRDVAPRQSAKCFQIFRGGSFDNFLRQARGRRSLVPSERLQIIAHELFVETRWALSDGILVLWPETRRVRREAFVNQEQIYINNAKLKFSMRDDDSRPIGVIAAARINFQA